MIFITLFLGLLLIVYGYYYRSKNLKLIGGQNSLYDNNDDDYLDAWEINLVKNLFLTVGILVVISSILVFVVNVF